MSGTNANRGFVPKSFSSGRGFSSRLLKNKSGAGMNPREKFSLRLLQSK